MGTDAPLNAPPPLTNNVWRPEGIITLAVFPYAILHKGLLSRSTLILTNCPPLVFLIRMSVAVPVVVGVGVCAGKEVVGVFATFGNVFGTGGNAVCCGDTGASLISSLPRAGGGGCVQLGLSDCRPSIGKSRETPIEGGERDWVRGCNASGVNGLFDGTSVNSFTDWHSGHLPCFPITLTGKVKARLQLIHAN